MASDLSSLAALCTPTSFLGAAVKRGAKPSPIKWTNSTGLQPLEAWVSAHLRDFPDGSVSRKACEPVFAALNLGAESTVYAKQTKKTLQDRVQNRVRSIVNQARINAQADDEVQDEEDAENINTQAPPLVDSAQAAAATTPAESRRLLDPLPFHGLQTPDSRSPSLNKNFAPYPSPSLERDSNFPPYPSLFSYDRNEDDNDDGAAAPFNIKEGPDSIQHNPDLPTEPRRAASLDASSHFESSSWLHRRKPHDPSGGMLPACSNDGAVSSGTQKAPEMVEKTPVPLSALHRTLGKSTEAAEKQQQQRAVSLDASSQFESESSPWLRQRFSHEPSGTLAYSFSNGGAGPWSQKASEMVEQTPPPSALRTLGRSITEAADEHQQHPTSASDADKMLELAAAAATVDQKKAAEAAARSAANDKRAAMNALFSDFFDQHRNHHHHRDAFSSPPTQTQIILEVEHLEERARKAVDEFNKAELHRMECWRDLQMARVARVFCKGK